MYYVNMKLLLEKCKNDSNTSSSSSSVTTRRKAKQGIQEILLHHPVGYFSKEKESAEDYNLACMYLPAISTQRVWKVINIF